jgi:quercetin dioxygenase-like cupin family protein
LLVTFDAGAESGDEPHSHVGDEFLIVIRGRLEVRVNSRVYQLRPGDSLTFPSSVPHRWRNPGRSCAVAVWVNTPPSW